MTGSARNVLARYGLGSPQELSVKEVKERLTETIRVIQNRLEENDATDLLARIKPIVALGLWPEKWELAIAYDEAEASAMRLGVMGPARYLAVQWDYERELWVGCSTGRPLSSRTPQ